MLQRRKRRDEKRRRERKRMKKWDLDSLSDLFGSLAQTSIFFNTLIRLRHEFSITNYRDEERKLRIKGWRRRRRRRRWKRK